MHTSEDLAGTFVSDEVGWEFTCPRPDHPHPGPYTWLAYKESLPDSGLSGVAEELGLAADIPAVLAQFPNTWVEYGVFERAYAISHPEAWARLMKLYSHHAVGPKKYTVSAFLAATLGHLQRQGAVLLHMGPATGRWRYNGRISWWALPPGPDWDSRLSWADHGLVVDYVPGRTRD